MSNRAWPVLDPEHWQAVTFPWDSSEAWQTMKEVGRLTFPLDSSEAWQAMKEVEIPLYGCRWTECVFSQITKIQSNPESWSCGEQITNDAITRDQLMLGFFLENSLIPFTTEQVINWLDWYGVRFKNNQELEIWYYPAMAASFHVDTMIEATSALVDFLFVDSHLFSAKVSAANGTMKDMLFTFVSKNKEEIAKREYKRPRRVRKKEGIDPAPATGSDSRPTTQTQEEADDDGPDSAEVLRRHFIDSED